MDGQRASAGRTRYDEALDKGRVRDADFTTLSPGRGRAGVRHRRLRVAGRVPVHAWASTPTGYRGRTWTIRQFAGFGNAQQTNERYKMILGRGGGGL